MLIFGTLYPTYLSYKALKQRDNKECTRMIMYWIVFAIYNFLETFLDIFIGLWFPFYFETKIIFIFWLISSYGNGAKILYENVVQQMLEQKEEVIDDFISRLRQIGISLFWKFWSKSSVYINYLLILSFNKAQIAFIQYMQDRNNHDSLFGLQNPFNSVRKLIQDPQMEQLQIAGTTTTATTIDAIQYIDETMESMIEDEPNKPSSIVDAPDGENLIVKTECESDDSELLRPGRKTKRKATKHITTDISTSSTNRPTTRASARLLGASKCNNTVITNVPPSYED